MVVKPIGCPRKRRRLPVWKGDTPIQPPGRGCLRFIPGVRGGGGCERTDRRALEDDAGGRFFFSSDLSELLRKEAVPAHCSQNVVPMGGPMVVPLWTR